MTRYLGLVMRGQLTTAEAIEWQYLKNANGSIKVAGIAWQNRIRSARR